MKQLLKKLNRLYNYWSLEVDAQWWEFWKPQSGSTGGALAGIFISSVTILLAYYIHNNL